MPNPNIIDKVDYNGTEYRIKDTVSGYTTNTGTVTSVSAGTGLTGGPVTTTGSLSLDTTRALTASDIITGTSTDNKLVSAKTLSDVISGLGGGTVTSVDLTNGGGLSISGGPITGSGSITVGHSNSVTAQNTKAVYPIKIDAQGHISEYGDAVPELFRITLSYNESTGEYSADKTFSQITDALDAGKYPFLITNDPEDGEDFFINWKFVGTLNGIGSGDETGYEFVGYPWQGQPFETDFNSIAVDRIIITESNQVLSDTITYKHLEKVFYAGTCSTAETTATKEVTCPGFTFLNGSIIGILFTKASTVSTPVLKINDGQSTPIYIGSSTPNGTTNVLKWSANTMIYFMYDGLMYNGSNFRYITSIAAGSVSQPRGANTWYGLISSSNNTASSSAKVVSIDNYVLTKGSLVVIKASIGNTYTGGSLTLNVNSTGAKTIYYNGSITSSTNTLLWDSGDILTFIYDGNYYTLISRIKNGTVTSVGLTNDTDGGLTISNSPITSSGNITIGHTNVLSSAQNTQAVYPIKIDKNGHISSYGSAVTIPTVNNGALKLQKDSGTASSIYTANQSGDTTLTYTTTSVGSASGWNAGSAVTLGTAIPADDITAWTTNTPTAIDTTKFSGGSFTRGSFSGGSFTQGTDSFTANTPTVIDTTKFSGGSFTRGSFSGGSFTQGTDSFTANTPTVIDTTKFSGGSFTRGSFSGGSFTQGTDSFTANTPTVINTSKFSGGSFTRGSFSGGSFSQGTDYISSSLGSTTNSAANPTTLTITFNQGSDTFTAATHGNDSFTAASLASGFYTAGTAATFSQGTDTFTAATHAADSFTAAKLNTGFYTAGTAATFSQGSDTFTAATHAADSFTAAKLNTGFYTAGTAASFTQGTDSFTAATHAADSFTAAKLNSGFYTAGSAASLSYTPKSIPNVTDAGTAPSLTISSTTVVNSVSSS